MEEDRARFGEERAACGDMTNATELGSTFEGSRMFWEQVLGFPVKLIRGNGSAGEYHIYLRNSSIFPTTLIPRSLSREIQIFIPISLDSRSSIN